jgi:hypothetical protein
VAKLKQPFDEARVVPWMGHIIVEPGAVVTVPDEDLASYLEGGWEPADAATKRAGKKLLDDGVITVLAGVTDQAEVAQPVDEPAGDGAVDSEKTEG